MYNYNIFPSYNTDLNIADTFKHIINELKEYVYSLFNKHNEDYIVLIKDKLNNLANVLESVPELFKEFVDFLKIKKILIYLLDNYDSLKSVQMNQYFDLIKSFHNILLLKIDYIKNNDLKQQYQSEYNHFKDEIIKARSEFHRNIYKRSDDFDDLMVEVSKVFME